MKAIWRGGVIAESDETIAVEGNHYFPPSALNRDYLATSDKHTVCSWKGRADYYHVVVNGEVSENAAWSYPEPGQAAQRIGGYVAFFPSVELVD